MAYNQQTAPFAHWMKREIYEQPGTLAATLEQYVDANGGLESCKNMQAWLREAQAELVIAASGSGTAASSSNATEQAALLSSPLQSHSGTPSI